MGHAVKHYQLNESVRLRLTNKNISLEFSHVIGSNLLVSNFRHLGVTIRQNLNRRNVKNICASVMRKPGLIQCKQRHSLSQLKSLNYNVLIPPKLEYCSIVWDSFTKKDISRMERMQGLPEQSIYGKHRQLILTTHTRSNNIASLQTRRKLARLRFLHKMFPTKINLNM